MSAQATGKVGEKQCDVNIFPHMEQNGMESKQRSGRSIFLRSLVSAAAAAVIIGALVSRTFSGGSHETDSEPLVFPAIAGGNAVITRS